MYYLFRDGMGEALSGTREALKELTVIGTHTEEKRTPQEEGSDLVETVEVTDYDPKAKIIEDARWVNPADLYLDEDRSIAIREYEPLPEEERPAEAEVPVDEERLALYTAMAAQEARLVEQSERIARLEKELKKGGDKK